jgi:hypothetical protein
MQVGDYIIQQVNAKNNDLFAIFKLLDIHVDGYLQVEPQAYYNNLTKAFYRYDRILNKPNKYTTHITRARIKPYQPTLEELFIFKQIGENPNGTYTLQE